MLFILKLILFKIKSTVKNALKSFMIIYYELITNTLTTNAIYRSYDH